MTTPPGSFSLFIRNWTEKMEARMDLVVRKVAIDLLSNVVDTSPVGNPERWAANEVAVIWNTGAAEVNAELRLNPANLTKAGRLKRGKLVKLKALPAGKGYVGGRFKGAWTVSVNSRTKDQPGRIDSSGETTKAAAADVLSTVAAGDVIYIQNNLPYALRLEYGWSKQAPSGMVGITMARFQSILDKAIRESKDEIP